MSPDPPRLIGTPLPLAALPLREYEAGLIRLQDLQVAGRNESDEAHAIRDAMDSPWTMMSPAERDLVGGLSADLYMLSGEEIREPADGAEDSANLDQRRSAMYSAQRWGDFLGLLRRGPTDLPPSTIAYLRYKAYEELGLQAAAGRFIERAVELAPRDTLKVLAIVHAQRSGDTIASVRLANAALASSVASAGLFVAAAGALLASTRGVAPDLAAPQWRRAADAVAHALESPTIADDEQVSGLIHQGLAFEFLGNASDARAAYAGAAAISPFHPLVRHARAGQPVDADRSSTRAGNVDARLRLIETSASYAGGMVTA